MKKKHVDAKKWQARHDAEQEEMRRGQCTLFEFWRGCARKACARAQRCDGDPHLCFERWWPLMPEELKVEYRAAIVALKAGLSAREASRAARAEVARWRALQVPHERDRNRDDEAKSVAAPAAARPAADATPVVARVRLV